MNHFGDILLNLLEKNNISQRELAAALQIAPTTLNGYIKNKHEPDYKTLIRIADTFQVSVDELLGHEVKRSQQEMSISASFSLLTNNQKELVTEMIQLMLRQNAMK
ncbi:helix-turn-helix transcriptional regulator [Ruminococcus sp.]|uniref:helix-turn-helix domain-containing protein n=1 Tax=Ruminococcus sp. TaxID=41978 RepID=UPI0025F34618|nr:helix-turn-helix transcriptional regulator [Ruminococcus sp.]